MSSLGGRTANVLTLNSMTKFYGVPGLRLGYAILPSALARLMRENLPPWTVNSLAQAVGAKALGDRDYQERSRQVCDGSAPRAGTVSWRDFPS